MASVEPAEQHPIIYWRLKEALEKQQIPPDRDRSRVTMLAQFAISTCRSRQGTDICPD